VMGRLVHTGLGSSSLVAHVLPYPPPPHVNSFVLGPAVINTPGLIRAEPQLSPVWSLSVLSDGLGVSV
jgi:hypothetical protein